MLMHANRMPRLPGPSLLHAVRDDCASYSELDFGHHLRLVHPPPRPWAGLSGPCQPCWEVYLAGIGVWVESTRGRLSVITAPACVVWPASQVGLSIPHWADNGCKEVVDGFKPVSMTWRCRYARRIKRFWLQNIACHISSSWKYSAQMIWFRYVQLTVKDHSLPLCCLSSHLRRGTHRAQT